MPVTKTAARALRVSKRKKQVNDRIRRDLEVAVRFAKREMSSDAIKKVIAFADKAAKKKVFHKNKAARIKSSISKLLPKSKILTKKTPAKKPVKASKKK